MFKNISSLLRGRYHALNRIEISVSSLLHNYDYLTKKCGKKIFPVLKSNAYGHGIVHVAKALNQIKAPFFCVDSIYEAYQLTEAKISTPILIMGYVHPESLNVKKPPFSYAVYEYEMMEAISKYQPHAGIHVFVDTGMHREGVPLTDLARFVKKCKASHLKIEGLMSHLAMANKPNNKDTKNQIKSFEKAKNILEKEGISPEWIHLGASSHILNHESYSPQMDNSARAGIALYGIDPENKNHHLKPVLKLLSTVVQVKNLTKGEKVGYDFTYTAQSNQKIAVIPIGYNDGVNRRLSNKGSVLIKNIFCPILGRVSMNVSVIDVTNVQNIAVGDEVIIYSDIPNHINSLYNSAKICDTIPYELLVYLHSSTKRIAIE